MRSDVISVPVCSNALREHGKPYISTHSLQASHDVCARHLQSLHVAPGQQTLRRYARILGSSNRPSQRGAGSSATSVSNEQWLWIGEQWRLKGIGGDIRGIATGPRSLKLSVRGRKMSGGEAEMRRRISLNLQCRPAATGPGHRQLGLAQIPPTKMIVEQHLWGDAERSSALSSLSSRCQQ